MRPWQRRRSVRRSVVERAEQQRQRRAELVADVAEERRLGAIDLGERLGAAPFLLVGVDVGQAGGDLARRAGSTKLRYASSSGRNGLSPATKMPGWTLLPLLCDRARRAHASADAATAPVGKRGKRPSSSTIAPCRRGQRLVERP